MTDGGAMMRQRVRPGSSRFGFGASVLLLGLSLLLAACGSSGPDRSYPNLSSVPDQAPRPSSESLQEELIEGLIADHANAQYSGENLTAQSAAAPPAAPPPSGQPRVEIRWEPRRFVLEGEETEEETAEETAEEETAEEIETAAEGEERVEITWEMARVLPAAGAEVAAAEVEELEEPIEVGGTQLVAVIYFAHDSSQLNEDDRDVLRDVVALHKERGGRIHLIGHSSARAETEDLVAQRMINLDLSLKRASQVADGLMGFGAQQEALLVEAKADSDPVAEEATATDEAGNRRVEIFLEY